LLGYVHHDRQLHPDNSSRYAGNVPAGPRLLDGVTFTLTTLVDPSPDENTFRLNVLPCSSGSAGNRTASALSSIVPAATVVSMVIDFGYHRLR